MKHKIIYFLVYQAGIANVFKVDQKSGIRTRVMQNAFGPCAQYCRGLKEAGQEVRPAWCNEAGDISKRPWSVSHFENAPFHEKFCLQF